MIEILHPGWQSLIVDEGRYGYGHIGVPPSSALDHLAYAALNYILGNNRGTPALEVLGKGFSIAFGTDLRCAITGAKVKAQVNEKPVPAWKSFEVKRGSVLRVKEVVDGFRYYIGFSGIMALERIISSFSTNLDCRFGGYKGRSLIKGDQIGLEAIKTDDPGPFPADLIPSLNPPHVLRIIDGAEQDFFFGESVKKFFEKKGPGYQVSSRSNRTGIRLEGEPLNFREGVEKSIISEGILPGTIQIPGDGFPIIALYERTIGGYARLGLVAKADHDRLAHLKPGDSVHFEKITMAEAESLWKEKIGRTLFLEGHQRLFHKRDR
jgi:antagonist of KipI